MHNLSSLPSNDVILYEPLGLFIVGKRNEAHRNVGFFALRSMVIK